MLAGHGALPAGPVDPTEHIPVQSLVKSYREELVHVSVIEPYIILHDDRRHGCNIRIHTVGRVTVPTCESILDVAIVESTVWRRGAFEKHRGYKTT